jgi:hypothetical protein
MKEKNVTLKETVARFSAYKRSKGLNPRVTEAEVKSLVKKMREAMKPTERAMPIKEAVARFSAYKRSKGMNPRVTVREAKILRRKMAECGAACAEDQAQKKPVQESKPTREGFKRYVENFRKYKASKKLGDKLTEDEFGKLKEKYLDKFKTGSFETLVENFKKYKKAKGLKETVSYRELKTLKDAFKKNPKLKEAGEEFAADPAMGAAPAADPNADPNAAAAPATPVDPTITAGIQAAKDAIDQLATSAGIQDPAAAGLEAGTDIGMPADPTQAAAGAAPLPESKKDRIAALRERITARSKALKEGDMSALTKAAHDQANTGVVKLSVPKEAEGDPNYGGKGQIDNVPTAAQLAKGMGSKGTEPAATWPTKKDVPQGGKALQGPSSTQPTGVKESTDDPTDAYLAKYFSPKLDFGSLKEALSKGQLG